MTRDELLDLIDQADYAEWTELDLRDHEIRELPPEIGRLTKLEKLLIGITEWSNETNSLLALPSEIGLLTQLKILDLSGNRLTSIPSEVGLLTNLQELNLRFNLLTSLPFGIAGLIRLKKLNLRTNWLTTISPEISSLINLRTLDLSGNQLVALPSEIGRMISLQKFDLSGNNLAEIAPEIGRLINLDWLSLARNQLTTIPPEISGLVKLRSFDLSENHLTSIPAETGLLSNLKWFNLTQNQLTTIPPEIGMLSNLMWLNLFNNQLTAIPSDICQLTNLKKLSLSANQLTAIPPEIGQLINLQEFSVGSNRLTAIPPEIGQLINLQEFSVGSNRLTAIPLEISKLTNLQELHISNNRIMKLPSEIGQLTNIKTLDLGSNQLTVLPLTIQKLTKIEEISLADNPLPLPPELVGTRDWPIVGSPKTIIDAYFQASRPLREAKLMLVGEGDVGKTAVVNRLLHNQFVEERSKTVGVELREWVVNSERLPDSEQEIRLHIWDFGGQEINHATHQFFLTQRSLYLLVIDASKDEAANRLDYWLRHIRSFAGDAPIILVVNKTDQHTSTLDERGILHRYPAVRQIVHTSCRDGTGLEDLHQAISDALAAMPHINDWIPLTWFAVKEKLAALDKDYLPYDSYTDLCRAEGIDHEPAQRVLARFLHDLGAALNFQDDRHLAGTHVLNPEWVTGGIYRILNADRLQGRGVLRLTDLDDILDGRRYPFHTHPFLLEIMRKFELCAPLGDGQRYLIPGLLSKEQSQFDWPETGAVALEYRYAILPAAVLTRLMVRLHHHIWSDDDGRAVRWRNGLVLARDGCRALVEANPVANRLTIALDGQSPHRRQLLSVIRAELAEIHASFAALEAAEWVPISGHSDDKAIAYDDLLFYEAQQEWTPLYAPIRGRIDVRALLDGIETQVERDIRIVTNKLREQFNMADLHDLAFELGVDYENLPGETKSELARELVLHCQRRGRLSDLERAVRKERPLQLALLEEPSAYSS